MHIDHRFRLRTIAGETIIVRQGNGTTDQTEIISLNNSARMLYEKLADADFTTADAADLLQQTYQISQEQAMQDAASWVNSLMKCHIITDESSLS